MHHSGRLVRGNRPAWFEGRSSRSSHVYDLLARRPFRVAYRRLASDIVETAPAGGAVLDVGTGPGVLLLEIARRRSDLQLTGVDPAPNMVTTAARNLAAFGERASARAGRATELPFPDGSFDLIISSLSLHHWDDPASAVPELGRVLRPGGRVQIYDFRFAPFREVSDAARQVPRFAGAGPAESMIRTGPPPFPKLTKYVLDAQSLD